MKEHIRAIFVRLFSLKGMLKPGQIIGELPTTGFAYKRALKIAWPSALEAVLVSLIGSIDTMMVGGLGPAAIAAVGITNQPKFILLSVIMSLNVGVTAIVARRRGQEDKLGANSCLRQSLLISFVISIIMAAVGFIFAEPLMIFAGAQDDVIGLSTNYFRIIMFSMIFTAISLTINAGQRGIGNTKISMRTNVYANLFNLVFNFILINGIAFFPKLGVNGAAIATVIGSAVGCVMSVMSVTHKPQFLHLRLRDGFRFDRQTIKSLVSISGSAMVEQVFMRVGFFAYAKIVAELGTVAFATHQICMNIINMSFAFGDGLSIASSSLVGQSLGAKRPDMAIAYGKIGQRMAFAISTVLFFVFIFGRKFLIRMFSPDPAIIALGGTIMIIIALCTHAQTSQVVFTGCLRGAGDTKFVAMISFISIGVIRPVLTYVLCLPLGFGLIGAWLSLMVDQGLRFCLSAVRFSKGKWTSLEV